MSDQQPRFTTPLPQRLSSPHALPNDSMQIFEGIGDATQLLEKRATELGIDTNPPIKFIIDDKEVRLRKLPYETLKNHFTNFPGPRGSTLVMTDLYQDEATGRVFMIKDFCNDPFIGKQAEEKKSQSSAKILHRNMESLRTKLKANGVPDEMNPVPRSWLAAKKLTTQQIKDNVDFSAEMNKQKQKAGLPTYDIKVEPVLLAIEYTSTEFLLRTIFKDGSYTSKELEMAILTIIDQLISIENTLEPNASKRFSTRDLTDYTDLFFTKIIPLHDEAAQKKYDEAYPVQGRLMIYGWESLVPVKERKPLEMTRSFIETLRIHLTHKYPQHSLSLFDFTDDTQWENMNISLATRYALSEIRNNKTLTSNEAKELLLDAMRITSESDDTIVQTSQKLLVVANKQEQAQETILVQVLRTPDALKTLSRDFTLWRKAIFYLDEAKRRSLTQTDIGPLADKKNRFFRHPAHAINVSNYKIGLEIMRAMIPLTVEGNMHEETEHLLRYEKLLIFMDFVAGDLPDDAGDNLQKFIKQNQNALNLEYISEHATELKTLFSQIEQFMNEHSIVEEASNAMRDFMADIRYRIASLEADTLRLPSEFYDKLPKWKEAKKYLDSIRGWEFKNAILKTAPDLDAMIADYEESLKVYG